MCECKKISGMVLIFSWTSFGKDEWANSSKQYDFDVEHSCTLTGWHWKAAPSPETVHLVMELWSSGLTKCILMLSLTISGGLVLILQTWYSALYNEILSSWINQSSCKCFQSLSVRYLLFMAIFCKCEFCLIFLIPTTESILLSAFLLQTVRVGSLISAPGTVCLLSPIMKGRSPLLYLHHQSANFTKM